MAKKYNKEKTDKDKEENSKVHTWLTRIDFAKRYMTKVGNYFRWDRLLEEYRGYFIGLQDSTDIYIPSLNYIFAYVKSEIPRLALRDPKIKINPKKGSAILSARILEQAVNYLWRVKKLKRENKKNVFDALLVGHSWFKTGYTGKFGNIEDGNGNTFEFIESEDFFGYRVPYKNITFNPDSSDPPFDCKWIAHEVWMPLDEVQKNKIFKHTEDLSPVQMADPDNDPTGKDDPLSNERRFDPDVKMVKLYEVWDKTNEQIFTISDGCGYYIREPRKWPYEMKGFPFSFLRLNDDPFTPYGLPDCFMFETQVIELIKIRATEIDHLKRFNRQLLLADGHMSDDAKDQFTQGVTGAVLDVQTNGRPLGDIVAPIPYPNIQTDIYAIEDRIQSDMVRIHGQTINEQGGVQKTSTRSLGELETMNTGAANRREDKIDTIEDFIEDIASNLVALLQQYADMPFYVSVAGDEIEQVLKEVQERPSASQKGAVTDNFGFTFTKEDIQGQFDFEVVPGSTTPLDSAQILRTLLEVLGQLPKLGVAPGPITEYIGSAIADNIGLEGLKLAVRDEIEASKARIAAIAKKEEELMKLQVAETTAATQIKAEREATKQGQLQLESLRTMAEISAPKEPKKNG
jgi:hypothetical protein